jgi:hypothetical protein
MFGGRHYSPIGGGKRKTAHLHEWSIARIEGSHGEGYDVGRLYHACNPFAAVLTVIYTYRLPHNS